MRELLSKLSTLSNKKAIEPREIFMSLPQKDKQYEYPRDVQTDVWKKWFALREQKNCIIKMNTGSGKTVVGLLILQSCLNEGQGPAAYIVPDKYLVSQVCAEAKRLGINATDDREDYLYAEKKSILVMTVQSLVNGRSVFGMRAESNYLLGSVLIDDVHACLDTITSQFSIKIPSTHELYNKIISIFEDRWKEYNPVSYTNIVKTQDPIKNALIPFWMWQDSTSDVLRTLKNYDNGEDQNKNVFFSLPLLEDSLSTCNCIITARTIEIIPFGINMSKIKSFADAKRRIFMSATLSDDSVFVSSMGLNANDVQNIITPDSSNDIGDRLILFPKHLNNAISNEEIRAKVFSISVKYNVAVIVPSKERARFWDATGQFTITKENIETAVIAIKTRNAGFAVFVNRYDGIDLPNDACRMLVIDGLPPLKNEFDKYIQSVDPSSGILLREQVQRIEQGMGRGVRANSDSCCIVLMGDKLADVLVRNKGMSYFGNATGEQYRLSKELWDLLMEEKSKPTIDEIFELADYSLNREVEWIRMSKDRLSSITYDSTPKIDSISVALRKAFDFSCIHSWNKAIEEIDKIFNKDIPDSTKGYLLQVKACYLNFIDQASSQQALLSAHSMNPDVLSPIRGIQYNKVINREKQAKELCLYAKSVASNPNEYLLHWNSIAADLSFLPDAHGFERAFFITGKVLGFISTRPDKETNGAGPDNLWAIGENRYFIVECKSGATVDTISKSYCNQLGGSVRWFKSEYGEDYQCQPIMVHKSNIIDEQATPVDGMKIMTQVCVERLKHQVSLFIAAIAQNSNWLDEAKINDLLQNYRLRAKDIVQEYTVNVSK